jgi:hypothetical protein
MLDLSMPGLTVEEANAEIRAMIDAAEEMDAPRDWDEGTVAFDPYV